MYYLFGYDRFYPRGGLNDYLGSFDDKEPAKVEAKNKGYEFYEIVIQEEGDYINPARLVVIERGQQNDESLIEWEIVDGPSKRVSRND